MIICTRWEKYMSLVNPKDDITVAEKTIPVDDLDRHFPFHGFFANAPHPLFHGRSYREDYEVAQSCWRYIQVISIRNWKKFFKNLKPRS